jgi:hypothetical protein
MPLLYGEEKKAFLRLQEEIIKIFHDQSIFRWNAPECHGSALASKSGDFDDSSNSLLIPCNALLGTYSMTHKGFTPIIQ